MSQYTMKTLNNHPKLWHAVSPLGDPWSTNSATTITHFTGHNNNMKYLLPLIFQPVLGHPDPTDHSNTHKLVSTHCFLLFHTGSNLLTHSNIWPHAHASTLSLTHTLTNHSRIIAKHTMSYVWTVSLTDQTHVDSLTCDLSAYDYSSSSDCSAWVTLLLHTHTIVQSLFTSYSDWLFHLCLSKKVHWERSLFSLLHIHTVAYSLMWEPPREHCWWLSAVPTATQTDVLDEELQPDPFVPSWSIRKRRREKHYRCWFP